MCARRFLTLIFVLTLIVVAGAFAVYQWGGSVLLEEATPKGHFEQARPCDICPRIQLRQIAFVHQRLDMPMCACRRDVPGARERGYGLGISSGQYGFQHRERLAHRGD